MEKKTITRSWADELIQKVLIEPVIAGEELRNSNKLNDEGYGTHKT